MARTVEIGTKLRKAHAPAYVLEVVEFIAFDRAPRHARTRVRLMAHDLGERLYSVSALTNPKLFVDLAK